MRSRRNPTRVVKRAGSTLIVAAMLVMLGGLPAPSAQAAGGGFVDLTGAVPATFNVRPGVELATVTGAPAGAHLTLADPVTNERLVTFITDSLGQAHFAYVPADYLVYQTGTQQPIPTTDGRTLRPGNYRIVNESASPLEVSPVFHVTGVDEHPPTSLYDGQTLNEGYQYVTMRDGVTLSITVRFPLASLYGPGPYPTVVEYSGYGTSNPDATDPGSRIAGLLGYATVGVNMRGSGCSGGVFDVFNPAQFADGYDVIETVARQPWVLHHKVGMVGLSYSGISQLFVASTAPPGLAAITPLSVIQDPWYQQWPGGIYNSGFTREWLAERDHQSAPSGTSWVKKRIDNGDTVCADNQLLRQQNPDFESFGRALEFRPGDADERNLSLLVPRINVPTYLTGAWQDEQTGSRFATMLDKFTGAPTKKFTMFNGRHPDGYTPLVLSRWYEFLELYVAKRVPHLQPIIRASAPTVFEQEFHAPNLSFEPDRFYDAVGDDYAAALARYQAEPEVRVLFENGAGDPAVPGSPKDRFEASYPSWPPPTATEKRFYLGQNESLTETPSAYPSVDRFNFDPGAGGVHYAISDAWDFLYPQIQQDWQPMVQGSGLSYLTPPLAENMVMAGSGYVDLWLRTAATDADLEVVLTEVYPDGGEVLVQVGLLRAGDRAVDVARSNGTFIEHFYDQAHYQPLPGGQFANLQIPLYPAAHPFRAGSRLRLSINTAGRDLPMWEFDNPAFGSDPVRYDIARGSSMASSLVLPIVPAIPMPSDHPVCNSLRGQPCRTFVPVDNELVESQEPPTTTTTAAPPTSTSSTTGPSTSPPAIIPVTASPAFTG